MFPPLHVSFPLPTEEQGTTHNDHEYSQINVHVDVVVLDDDAMRTAHVDETEDLVDRTAAKLMFLIHAKLFGSSPCSSSGLQHVWRISGIEITSGVANRKGLWSTDVKSSACAQAAQTRVSKIGSMALHFLDAPRLPGFISLVVAVLASNNGNIM